jgi:hypothetical protein
VNWAISAGITWWLWVGGDPTTVGLQMKQGRLRGTLLATSSALALMVGAEGAAQAQCAFNNVNGAITNTTTNNCISFNNGGTFSGPVTNASSGTLNASGGTPNQPNSGTATGISVVGGSHLTGAITNQGSITTSFRGINVGGGQYGAPGGFVTGSITNNGSITANRGIELSASSTLTGDVVNNGTINYTDTGINVNATAVTAGTITGSIINAGTLSGIGGGIGVQHYTVTGSITNTVNGTITSTAGFAGMELSLDLCWARSPMTAPLPSTAPTTTVSECSWTVRSSEVHSATLARLMAISE